VYKVIGILEGRRCPFTAPSQSEIRLQLTLEENKAGQTRGTVMWINEGINLEQSQCVFHSLCCHAYEFTPRYTEIASEMTFVPLVDPQQQEKGLP